MYMYTTCIDAMYIYIYIYIYICTHMYTRQIQMSKLTVE